MTYDMESTALVLIQHNPAPALQDDHHKRRQPSRYPSTGPSGCVTLLKRQSQATRTRPTKLSKASMRCGRAPRASFQFGQLNPTNIWIWLQERADGLPTQAWETLDEDLVGEKITYTTAKKKSRMVKMKLAKSQKNGALIAALAAIKSYHQTNSLPFDSSNLALTDGINGMRRDNVSEQRQMAAMTPDLINKILISFTDKEKKDRKAWSAT
jgi:hypothetical protein